jgi:hypothetical protein
MTVKRLMSALLTLAVATAVAAAPEPDIAGQLRVLVVTGGHDYPTSFYTVFENPGAFRWDHAASNHEAFRADLRSRYDVLVLYDSSGEISQAEKKNLAEFAKGGKGIVVMHHALTDYPDWEWWWRDVVGGRYLLKPEGGKPASTYLHDVDLKIEPVGEHPMLAGIGPFELQDETYKGLWISPQAQLILKTDHPTSDGPVAWISPFQASRVVVIQLGHGEPAHRHPAFRRLVHNAILWTGARVVP